MPLFIAFQSRKLVDLRSGVMLVMSSCNTFLTLFVLWRTTVVDAIDSLSKSSSVDSDFDCAEECSRLE